MNDVQRYLITHEDVCTTLGWFMFGKPWFDYRIAHWRVHGTTYEGWSSDEL